MKRKYKIWAATAAAAVLVAGAAVFTGISGAKAEDVKAEALLEAEKDTIREIYTDAYQDQVEARLDYAKETGNYTEDAMLIEPNPYGTNNLSLYVYFKTEEATVVSYSVSVPDEEIGEFHAVPAGEEEPGTEHEFQVIGLVPGYKNTVTFTVCTAGGEQRTYQYRTDKVSASGEEEVQLEETKSEQVTESETTENGNELYVILGNDSDDLDFMYYYDRHGVLRGEIPIIGYRSHRLLFQNGLMYYSISQTKIAAVNALGKVESVYDTGNYELHHDYVLDGDGNLLVLATDTESDSVEDRVLYIDTQTGETEEVLDLGDLFASYKAECTVNSSGDLDWMHINTIQWTGEEEILLSSRETSTILKITDLYSEPKVAYMIGEESFWKGTEYETLLLEKDAAGETAFGMGGQHSITYVEDTTLPEGEYYLYMFNNNLGVSETNPDYDWSQIEGIAESVSDGEASYFYKYKVNETDGTYALVQSFEVPFSAYVSSAQDCGESILIDSGMQGIFGEYDEQGNLLRQFQMTLSKYYIYRVYQYDFQGFYFAT